MRQNRGVVSDIQFGHHTPDTKWTPDGPDLNAGNRFQFKKKKGVFLNLGVARQVKTTVTGLPKFSKIESEFKTSNRF